MIADGAQTGLTVVLTDAGALNITVTGQTPPATTTLFFGTSDDDTPEGAELTVPGVNGEGTINAYVGSRHHLIARLASQPDIASVLYSDDQSMTNQIGAFTKFAGSVIPTGETEAFSVWVSNQALNQSADVILTVA